MTACFHSENCFDTTMTVTGTVLFIAILVAAKADNLTKKPSEFEHPRPNNGIVGVASIAGITSRNGRISSLGGIKFFGPESINGDRTLFYPLSVSTEKDGHFASGTVRVHPGSRGISTSATAGYVPPGWSFHTPSSFFFQPSPEIFQIPKNVEPWFAKDVFKNFARPNIVRNDWMYPNFNPFMNFWR